MQAGCHAAEGLGKDSEVWSRYEGAVGKFAGLVAFEFDRFLEIGGKQAGLRSGSS